MMSCGDRAGLDHEGWGWSERSWTAALVACVLLALAGQAGAGPEARDSRLSATLVGRLEPGAAGRLAVRWEGPPGALLDAWVDLDGDGRLGPGELVVDGRLLVPGIEVMSFEVTPGGRVQSAPEVRVEVRGVASSEADYATGAEAPGRRRDDCAWQPGFTFPDFNSDVYAMTVFDDGSGPALYVGGNFTAVGGVTVNYIARWDGTAWSPLGGPSGIGTTGAVSALAVFDDGSGPAL